MQFHLNELEEITLQRWLSMRSVKKILKNDGQLAVIFSNGGGIGVVVEAIIRDKNGNELSKDITDYGNW